MNMSQHHNDTAVSESACYSFYKTYHDGQLSLITNAWTMQNPEHMLPRPEPKAQYNIMDTGNLIRTPAIVVSRYLPSLCM